MSQPIDINSLTIEQAKALAFDELVKIEAAQKNLQILNQIIAKRNSEVKPEQTEEKSKKKTA